MEVNHIPGYITIKILAVTRMLNQICVAGIDDTLNWKRPVRQPSLNLLRSDIFQGSACVIKNYNQVCFKCDCELNNVPHSEDFKIDSTYAPRLLNEFSIEDLEPDLSTIDESDEIEDRVESFLIQNNRSLVLIKPEEILNCTWINRYNNRYQSRIQFEFNEDNYDLPCTDLRWRAFGKIVENRDDADELLSDRDTYFVIGLARELNGRYWPMVVGVHAIPVDEWEIDYNNL